MAVSRKQLKANQENAKKSTGPRDTSKTRLNALRHGLCAREVLIPGENAVDLAAFAEGVRNELRASGALEDLLVDRIVSLAWRLRRAAVIEAGIFVSSQQSREKWVETLKSDLSLGDGREPEVESKLKVELAETFQFSDTPSHFANLVRYERTLEGGFYRALNTLAAWRKNGFVSQKTKGKSR